MKAIVRKAYGTTDELEVREVPMPEPKAGEVLIKVMAFGLNRAEIYMRKGAWGEVAAISGIECVGTVALDPSGTLEVGQKVAAMMGGMGRTINGSYAEYACPPRQNVVPLTTSLSWAELAAIPESYATAWACLHQNLVIGAGGVLVVRGGTSALGQAAINIAVHEGQNVIASTRNQSRAASLTALGASAAVIESPYLSAEIRARHPEGVDAVLDLVGNTTLLDSLKMVRKGGTVCNAGFLGGGAALALNPLTDMPSGANLNFFGSFVFGTPAYPLSEIPLQTIVERAADHLYQTKPAHVFAFDQIRQAHALMESNAANGKIVMTL